MLIAFKTWLQAPSNPDSIPTEWPWIQEQIDESQFIEKIEQEYQVLSESAFQAYLDAHDEKYAAWKAIQDEKIAQKQRLDDLEEKVRFGKDLLIRFKYKNIAEGINWMQAIHLHSRIKDWIVTYPTAAQFPVQSYMAVSQYFAGRSKSVDLVNMLTVSGDVESTYFSLMFGQNDDGSMPEHWVTDERRKWLISEIKTYLGW